MPIRSNTNTPENSIAIKYKAINIPKMDINPGFEPKYSAKNEKVLLIGLIISLFKNDIVPSFAVTIELNKLLNIVFLL